MEFITRKGERIKYDIFTGSKSRFDPVNAIEPSARHSDQANQLREKLPEGKKGSLVETDLTSGIKL